MIWKYWTVGAQHALDRGTHRVNERGWVVPIDEPEADPLAHLNPTDRAYFAAHAPERLRAEVRKAEFAERAARTNPETIEAAIAKHEDAVALRRSDEARVGHPLDRYAAEGELDEVQWLRLSDLAAEQARQAADAAGRPDPAFASAPTEALSRELERTSLTATALAGAAALDSIATLDAADKAAGGHWEQMDIGDGVKRRAWVREGS